ncbi:hypothetical protein ACH5RR_003076 [Cinchona calisaya]|uniref:Uncharacterized protein n=1 Tax=Cinchona calisaya TaxID=153742 RepID=A0ABD3ATT5_9GENT
MATMLTKQKNILKDLEKLEIEVVAPVMERARKRKDVNITTRTGDDEIHSAEMEVPLINLVHGSRNAASKLTKVYLGHKKLLLMLKQLQLAVRQ